MELSIRLLPPVFDERIRYSKPVIEKGCGTKQEFNPIADTIEVAALSEQQAMEYGELLKKAFVEYHQNLRSSIK